MIAAWMLYTVVVTLLLLAGASAAEYVARALRAPTRVVWAVAMITVIVLSARAFMSGLEIRHDTVTSVNIREGLAMLSGEATESARDHATRAEVEHDLITRVVHAARAAAAAIYRIEQSAVLIDVRPFDRWNGVLVSLWVAASAIALWWLVGSLVRLHRIERELATTTVHEHSVLVSRDMGPALLGVLRSRIVLPEWVLALPARERDAILAHEREHVKAHDPALFVAAVCLATLLPWHVALWAMLARLRSAIEGDCDRRVLDGMADRDERWYGRLIISVYERTTPGLPLTIALVARPSNLELRIRRIARRPRILSLAGVAASVTAAVLVLTAFTAAPPVRREAPPVRRELPPIRPNAPTPVGRRPSPERPSPETAVVTVPSEPSMVSPETRCSLAERHTVLWPGQWPVNAGCSLYGDIVVVYIDSTNVLVAARDTADVGVTAFFVFETTPGTTTPELVWSTTRGRALLSDTAMSFTSATVGVKPLVLRLWPTPTRTPRPDVLELRIDNMMMAEMRGIAWDVIAQLPDARRCTAAERESETMPTVGPGRSAPRAADETRRACFVTSGQRFQFPILSPTAAR